MKIKYQGTIFPGQSNVQTEEPETVRLTVKWFYKTILKNKKLIVETKCSILDESDFEMGVGITQSSTKDQYCKEVGRKKSLTRALQDLTDDKGLRTAIWEKYRTLTKNPRWGKPVSKQRTK